MIITIISVNSSSHIVAVFFLMIKRFKIYSLSHAQINNIILLTIVIMLYLTSSELINFITGSLYILTTFTQYLLKIEDCLP